VADEVPPKPVQIGNALQMLQDRVHVTVEPPCWIAPQRTYFPGWSGVVEVILQCAIPVTGGILLNPLRIFEKEKEDD
jgi:hypothetical protein